MKRQRITKLIIRNFRGIEYQEFNFYNDDLNNSILNPIKTGKNGTGKTTVLDSISYLYNNKKSILNNRINGQRIQSDLAPNIVIVLQEQENEDLAKITSLELINGSIRGCYYKYTDNLADVNMDDLTNEEVNNFIKHNINLSYDLFNELHVPQYFFNLLPSEQKATFLKVFFSNIQNKEKLIAYMSELKSKKEILENLYSLIINKDFNFSSVRTYLNAELKNTEKKITVFNEQINVFNDLINKKIIDAEFKEYKNNLLDLNNCISETQSLNIDLEVLKEIETYSLNLINNSIREYGDFNFEIEFRNIRNKDELFILYNGIGYKDLNTASKKIVTFELVKYFQYLKNINTFILVDDTEQMSSDTLQKVNEILKDHQVLCVKVVNE